ncbi:MAG: uracil-DNA glycosylase [Sphingomonas sp.]|nr:uracil-DNA glycosylase [Sphingomonas sp.]
MAVTLGAMGGKHDRLSAAEAASVLGWWIEAGVDVAVQEKPRAWLGEGAAAPVDVVPAPPVEEVNEELPDSLEAFRSWLGESSAVPLARAGARRVLPVGGEAAEVMLIADVPAPEDASAGQPIGGAAWELTKRMLAAIGIAPEQAYVANVSCIHSPGSRLSPKDLEACGAIVRRHVALAGPRRLLLLGDAPCRAVLDKRLGDARGHVQKVEGVRAVATFPPRLLLEHPSNKALAWKDLLLLMEDEC